MLKIRWTDDCVIGIESIDKQHHHLVDVMNTLAVNIEALKKNQEVDNKLLEIANELIKYTEEHFADEEELYLKEGISIEYQAKQHQEFTDRLKRNVRTMMRVESEKDVTEVLHVYSDLLSWFMNHIKVDDKNEWKNNN